MWDHSHVKRYPKLALIDGAALHPFCPAKLFRDDPAFVRMAEELYAEWRAGLLPGGAPSAGLADSDALDLWILLVQEWERQERAVGHRFLLALATALFSGGKKHESGGRS